MYFTRTRAVLAMPSSGLGAPLALAYNRAACGPARIRKALQGGPQMSTMRVQVKKDGSIVLPKNVLDALEAETGSYLLLTIEENRVVLEKTIFDPFAEVQQKVDPDAFDKILKKQKEGLDQAERDFMQRIKGPPPEIKPEDRLEFWD
jgi:bifunctional DNA-binding transcriptional regulator/antitoxin component of YhaV-PrlF toxin-antitoxin module